MVRPQTSQVTLSWTGRSSFFTDPIIGAVLLADRRRSIVPISGLYGFLLLLRLVDPLLRQVPRNLLVARQLHRVLAPPAGDRAQVGRVAQDLRHRDLRLDLGERALGLHPE